MACSRNSPTPPPAAVCPEEPSRSKAELQAPRGTAISLFALTIALAIAPTVAALCGRIGKEGAWIYSWALLVAPQLLWCSLESRCQVHSAKDLRQQRCRLSAAAGVTALAVMLLATWSVATSSSPLPGWHSVFGLLLAGVGMAMRLRAINDLGERFRNDIALGHGHRLETRGIFRGMRHPSELGLLLILGGSALIAASLPAAALVLLVSLPISIRRCRDEDELLLQSFGDEARAYQESTPCWSLVPLAAFRPRDLRHYFKNLPCHLRRPLDGLIAISLASGALWWLEVMARGWGGLHWAGYFHLALPIGMMLFLVWLESHCGIRSSTKRYAYLATIGGFAFGAYVVTRLAMHAYWAPLWSGLLLPLDMAPAARWLFHHSLFFVFPLVPFTFWLLSRFFGIRFRLIGWLAGLVCYALAVPAAILMLELVKHPGSSDLIHTIKTGFCIPLLMLGLGFPFVFRYNERPSP